MLNFYLAYQLTPILDGELYFPRICAGVLVTSEMLPPPYEHIPATLYRYFQNSCAENPMGYFYGTPLEQAKDGSIYSLDVLAKERDAVVLKMEFRRLTLALFDDMKDHINGWDRVREGLKTDNDLQLYYQDMVPEWWEEQYKATTK